MKSSWILNTGLLSFFVFSYLVIACKTMALGYAVSRAMQENEQLRSWNRFYQSRVLMEFSRERIRERVKQLGIPLEDPSNWRVIVIEDSNNSFQETGKAEAATR